MSEATTGVAHANARVSTIPKLSRPIDGATSSFACRSSSVSGCSGIEPSRSMLRPSSPSRRMSHFTESGSAPTTRSRAPVASATAGQARNSTARPFRGSCRPMNTTCGRRPAGSAAGGMTTPFGMTSTGSPRNRRAVSAARSDTAILWSIRSVRTPKNAFATGYQRIASPELCEVVTSGASARVSAYAETSGANGSWTWMTSKRSRSKARAMRRIDCGVMTMFESDPFAGTMTERPMGIT